MNHVFHTHNATTSGTTRISYSFNHSNLGSWIMDSGASDHICSFMRFFYDYKKIVPVNIRLPNGQIAIAKHVGTVKFSPDLIAHNVLFVHDFNLNLLYVPKHCIDIACIIVSNNDKCLI